MIRRLMAMVMGNGRETHWVPYSSRSLWATAAMPLTTCAPEPRGPMDVELWKDKARAVIDSGEPLVDAIARALANDEDACLLENIAGRPCAEMAGSLDQYAMLHARHGKPSRWCWPCWHRRNEDDLQAALLAVGELYANDRRWNG